MPSSPDYRKILTELYEKYNPEKVKDVEFLLKKFAGREEEMIEKIRMKYGEEPAPNSPEPLRKSFPFKKFFIGMAVVLGLGAATFGGMALVERLNPREILASDNARDTLFVIADTVFSRVGCGDNEQRNLPLPFGEKIVVFERVEAESGVKCIQTEIQGKDEFVPAQYLGDRREYMEIDAIYGNKAARKLYDNSYEKRMLLGYFRDNELIGEISPEWQEYLYDSLSSAEQWQVFGKPHNGLDAVAKGKYTPSWSQEAEDSRRPLDFAVIISRVDTLAEDSNEEEYDGFPRRNTQRLLLFAFDQSKEGRLVDELNISNYPGHYIRSTEFYSDAYWWGNYLHLDKEAEDGRELQTAILLEDVESDGSKYLIEVVDDQLQITALRETIFGYARDNTVIP